MSVTEYLMRPGSGTVELIPATPFSVTAKLLELIESVGLHVYITPVPIDVSLGATAIKETAIYGAKCEGRPTRTSLEFAGLSVWLDDLMETALSKTAGTPTQWITDLLRNDLTVGTVTGGSNVTHELKAYAQMYRGGLDLIAEMGGWEYEVLPTGVVNAGTSANVFRSPPQVVITANAEGADGPYFGLMGTIPGPSIDASNPATKVVAIGQGEGQAIVYGSATQSITLQTMNGNTPTLVRAVNAPSQTAAGATTVANAVIAQLPNTSKTISVTTGGTNLGTGFTGGSPSFQASDQRNSGKRFGPKNGKGSTGGAIGTLRPGQIGYKSPTGGTDLGSGGGPSFNLTPGPTTGGFKRLANTVARLALGLTGNRRNVGATGSESQFVRRYVRPGDEVYVYDLEAGIIDTANEIQYRGETISPILLRVTSMTWAIESGLGVYAISNDATPVVIDLTSFVQWEAPGANLDVTDWTPASYGVANRSNPAIESRVAGSPVTSWTSVTVTQSGSVAGTINSGWYVKNGDGTFEAHLTWTASAGGSAGNIITVTTPLTLTDAEFVHGTLTVAAATNRAAIVYPNNTTSVRFMCEGSSSLLGSNPAYTIANTNVFRLHLWGRYA